MDSDVITRILVEIGTGKLPAMPDTAEMAAMRAQLKIECDEIVTNGGVVDIPHEIVGNHTAAELEKPNERPTRIS